MDLNSQSRSEMKGEKVTLLRLLILLGGTTHTFLQGVLPHGAQDHGQNVEIL